MILPDGHDRTPGEVTVAVTPGSAQYQPVDFEWLQAPQGDP